MDDSVSEPELETALRKIARLAWGTQTEQLNELEASRIMDILASAANSSWVTIDFPTLADDFKDAASRASWEEEHRDDWEIESALEAHEAVND